MSNWESAQSLKASGAQTTSSAGSTVDLGSRDRLLRQRLSITAVSGTGTPTLTARIEASADGSTGWRTVGTYAAATAIGTERLSLIVPERYVRAAWTISGSTPSFTFAVAGTKGVAYATLEQLDELGLPPKASASIPVSTKAEVLAAATELVSGKLARYELDDGTEARRYTMPLVTWGLDITQTVCKIAAYDLMTVRGYAPDAANDRHIRARYDDAMTWLDNVARGRLLPIGLAYAAIAPDATESESFVVTHEARAWR